MINSIPTPSLTPSMTEMVLPFRIDYINTVKQKDGKQDKQVAAIDTEEALASQERISEVVKYILEHFDQKTMRNSYYSLKGQRVNGFNSMLAVSSISVCQKYYLELKKQIAEQHRDLTIATIFSFAPTKQIAQMASWMMKVLIPVDLTRVLVIFWTWRLTSTTRLSRPTLTHPARASRTITKTSLTK